MVRKNDIIWCQKSYLIYRFTWILLWTSKIDDSLLKLWFSCRKCSFHLKDSYTFLVCWCYLVLPWGWTSHPCHHPSSIRATSVSSWESAIANFPADGVQAQISSVIRRSLGRLCFCFSWKQLEVVGSEPDEFHHRFSTMILGYVSRIVEEKRNVLYAYWHFHRSAKSLRAFGWFVGGASCADQILLVGQVMENLIRISKRRRYEFPKSTTGSRRNVLDLFVQSVQIGRARSFFLLNIHTSLKEACLFWQPDVCVFSEYGVFLRCTPVN